MLTRTIKVRAHKMIREIKKAFLPMDEMLVPVENLPETLRYHKRVSQHIEAHPHEGEIVKDKHGRLVKEAIFLAEFDGERKVYDVVITPRQTRIAEVCEAG